MTNTPETDAARETLQINYDCGKLYSGIEVVFLRMERMERERDQARKLAEYMAADRVIMVIQTMIDHAFSADDDVPGDHVVERLYNLIAAIHPEGALPNPLSEYMVHADG